jgi:hypothetical protein
MGLLLLCTGSIFLMIATYFFPIAMAIAIAEDTSEISEGAYPALALEIGLGTLLSRSNCRKRTTHQLC